MSTRNGDGGRHTPRGGAADAWVTHMRRGDFAAAWMMSDAAIRARAGAPCWHLPRHLQPVWTGESFDDRHVLVRCYHGLGDTLQFIRYAPLVSRIANEVTVWAQEPLLRILSTVQGIDRVLPLHDGTPDVSYDVDVEIMELPHVFRSTLGRLPNTVPYLHVPAAARRDDGRFAVGLVWQAGEWDPRRSVPVEMLAPLAELPDVALTVLQRGPALAERPPGFGRLGGSNDVWQLARGMQALDLVITVDSMPAHLAGALGVPVWTLLHVEPDWRWMDGREDCPWYPTMRLFRQQRAGEWEPVIARVVRELTRAIEQRAHFATPLPLRTPTRSVGLPR